MYFKLNRLDSVVLMHNVWMQQDFGDGNNNADKTFEEMVLAIQRGGLMGLELLEACLYCCNMNHEDSEIGFQHPFGIPLKQFVGRVIGHDYTYDYYYNVVRPKGKYVKN